GERAATNRARGLASQTATEQPCVPGVTIFAFPCLAASPSASWPSRCPQQQPLLRAPNPWPRPSMMPGGLAMRRSSPRPTASPIAPRSSSRAGPSPRPARGFGYAFQKDFDRALADFDAATRNNPKLAAAYYYRGAIQMERDPKRALADINKAISLNPRDPDYFRERSSLYAKRKEYPRAIADLTTA